MERVHLAGLHEEIGAFAGKRFADQVDSLAFEGKNVSMAMSDEVGGQDIEVIFYSDSREGAYELDDGRKVAIVANKASTVGDVTMEMGDFVVQIFCETESSHGMAEVFSLMSTDGKATTIYASGHMTLDRYGNRLPDEISEKTYRAAKLFEQLSKSPGDAELEAAFYHANRELGEAQTRDETEGGAVFSYARYGEVMKVLRAIPDMEMGKSAQDRFMQVVSDLAGDEAEVAPLEEDIEEFVGAESTRHTFREASYRLEDGSTVSVAVGAVVVAGEADYTTANYSMVVTGPFNDTPIGPVSEYKQFKIENINDSSYAVYDQGCVVADATPGPGLESYFAGGTATMTNGRYAETMRILAQLGPDNRINF